MLFTEDRDCRPVPSAQKRPAEYLRMTDRASEAAEGGNRQAHSEAGRGR